MYQQEDDLWVWLELPLSMGELELIVDGTLPREAAWVDNNVPCLHGYRCPCVADMSKDRSCGLL